MKNLKIVFLSAICSTLFYSSCFGVSGAPVLSQTTGARAMGMGEAFTAISDDANAIYWNPSGMANMTKKEFSAMHLSGFVDNTYTSMAFAYPGSTLVFGGGVMMYDGGSFELNTVSETKMLKAQTDNLVVLSVAKKDFITGQSSAWNVGASFKYLSSTLIEKYSANTYALDFGVLTKSEKTSVGFLIQNIGSGIMYFEETDPLPMNIRAGVAYKMQDSYLSDVTVSGEVVKPFEEEVKVHLGAEYWYAKLLALRVGFKTGYSLESYTAGIGIHVTGYQFDMGFGPMGVLGNVNRISFTAKF
ncbi:MAG: hypothetical protein A2252_11790 [Elusimicrobia bacterium RIFOXYA2_FULL_39_19]|nr:MAG: hypothetical protein A2252_11790 [Elusimicrobia bacterium RIFOXYA2_FULL_39_19]